MTAPTMQTKRTNPHKIEVFTADCPICREALRMVRSAVAGCGCDVVEHRCEGDTCCESARQYRIKAQPTFLMNGRIVVEGRPTAEQIDALLAD